ncbi:hypothetical protein K0B96_15740 [Horticoccus luteus]|uniref:Galactose mutarotase-like enzyme n=1 Tax=Horticoccus luteus TaxID=2862869 RepID=A0A8F9TT43_9BACT|nr:hypothetical protein [Horticoccus luteus]QYM78734.1 hypothetical protein K0B96_15740 [Horticoccus luteus]
MHPSHASSPSEHPHARDRSSALAHHAIDGFPAVTLRNASIATTIVPALGARMISLHATTPGAREWMWAPPDHRGLFACAPDTAFENGPAAGLDECIPTVALCTMDGTAIADHGEVWSRAWDYDPSAETDAITTRIALRSWPLSFQRRVSLDGSSVHFDYTLVNTADRAVPYLWAFHPLFTLGARDEIELVGTSDVRVTGSLGSPLKTGDRGPWPTPHSGVRLDLAALGADGAPGTPAQCKAFLATAHAPRIALVDRARGQRLTLAVDPAQLPAWGYWVSRGGWHGHTHVALEATNAPADALTDLTPGPATHTLASRETRTWRVTLTLDTVSR